MVEVKLGVKTVDLPFDVRIYGVTEEMFEEMTDPDIKAELFDGVMIVHSPGTLRHDDVGGFIRLLMRGFAAARRKGRVFGPGALIHLATCRRFAPDAFFLRKGRLPRRLPKEFEGAPDQVVEVLSPSNRNDDLEDKRPAFQAAGVDEIWLVDPENQEVIIDRRRGDEYEESRVSRGKVTSEALEGFWLNASWLWAQPLPNEMACLRKILSSKR